MFPKLFGGALIAGIMLYLIPGTRNAPACLLAGALATWLLLLVGPRSIVEKIGLLLGVGIIAWCAGPRPAVEESLLWHLGGWTAAAAALAFYLHPKSE